MPEYAPLLCRIYNTSKVDSKNVARQQYTITKSYYIFTGNMEGYSYHKKLRWKITMNSGEYYLP